jgi:hypothetical protein
MKNNQQEIMTKKREKKQRDKLSKVEYIRERISGNRYIISTATQPIQI